MRINDYYIIGKIYTYKNKQYILKHIIPCEKSNACNLQQCTGHLIFKPYPEISTDKLMETCGYGIMDMIFKLVEE